MTVAVLAALALLIMAPFHIASQAAASVKPSIAEQFVADPAKFLGQSTASTIDMKTFRVLETAPNGDIAYVALGVSEDWVIGIASSTGGATASGPRTERSLEFGTQSAGDPFYDLKVTRIGDTFDHTLTISADSDSSAQH